MENTRHECRYKLKQEFVEASVKQETSICRGCLTTERRMVNAMAYDTLFRDLTGITISPTDGLPQWLCYECAALLHKYNRFRSKVIESHHKLCQYVLESKAFAVKEDATPHLSRTRVLHYYLAGSQSDELEEEIDYTVEYDTDMLYETVESVELKSEPISSHYEDIVEEEYREETPQTLLKLLLTSDTLLINSGVTEKHAEQAEEGEASSQEPHVGTEAAQQHLDEDVEEEVDVVSLDIQQPLLTTQMAVRTDSLSLVPSAQQRHHTQRTVEIANTRRSRRLAVRERIVASPAVAATPPRWRRRRPCHRQGCCSNSDSDAEKPVDRRSKLNDMERMRRSGLRSLFDDLNKQIPATRHRKRAPNILILREATVLCRKLRQEDLEREKLKKKQHQLVTKLEKLRKMLSRHRAH